MAKYEDAFGKEHDDKNTIPSGAPTFHGKSYMCAYCHKVHKPASDQLPTCPKCGHDRWLK